LKPDSLPPSITVLACPGTLLIETTPSFLVLCSTNQISPLSSAVINCVKLSGVGIESSIY